MTVYLAVGAQRVHTWLVRTPELRLLRGASAALSAQTDINAPAMKKVLADLRLRACSEAGNVDGVVVAEADSLDTARSAAPRLVRHLAGALPGVEWSAWRVSASTYASAVAAALQGSVARLVAAPHRYDQPVADACRGCGAEMRGLSNDLGPDCAARQGATRAPRALLDDLKGDWPDTFDDLAGRGGDPQQRRVRAVGRKESSSQLALVNADGNKLGSFFEALNTFDLDVPNLRNRAPGDVDFATRTAVEIAASSIHEPTDRHKSAIPHYVGGDDVLVSVPAARAWTFVTELIRGFSTLQDTLRACLACDIPEEGAARELLDRIAELSLGVGVAFTHATHPVSDATVHAELALKAAKREFRGQAAGIAWVDLTADGLTGARAGRRWIQVVSADEAFRQLLPTPVGASIAEQAALEVFALPPAARHRLGQILRDSSLGAAAGRVSTWAGRRAHDGAAVPKAISQLAQDDTDRLRALLSRARWWPRANREDQP